MMRSHQQLFRPLLLYNSKLARAAPKPRTDLGYRTMTTVVFSIQHAGAPKLEEIVVEVHPEWAPIGAQCVRPATAA